LITTTKTDENGEYKFSELTNGVNNEASSNKRYTSLEANKEYIVKFEVPETYLVTKAGGDSNVNKLAQARVVIPSSGEVEVSMGIICDCESYKLNPEDTKELSASALNVVGAFVSFFIFSLLARKRRD